MNTIRFCRVRTILPNGNVTVWPEQNKTKAIKTARREIRHGRNPIGTIIDIISPVQFTGHRITHYCVVAGWKKNENAWKKLPDRDGIVIDGALEVYV